MATLVKFMDEYGEDVFINPDDVLVVSPSSRRGYSYIYVQGIKGGIYVACGADEVKNRLRGHEMKTVVAHRTEYDYKDMAIQMVITIGCTDEEELLQHLSVLRQNLKRKLKKTSIPLTGATGTFRLEDNNCYGIHEATIML